MFLPSCKYLVCREVQYPLEAPSAGEAEDTGAERGIGLLC